MLVTLSRVAPGRARPAVTARASCVASVASALTRRGVLATVRPGPERFQGPDGRKRFAVHGTGDGTRVPENVSRVATTYPPTGDPGRSGPPFDGSRDRV